MIRVSLIHICLMYHLIISDSIGFDGFDGLGETDCMFVSKKLFKVKLRKTKIYQEHGENNKEIKNTVGY